MNTDYIDNNSAVLDVYNKFDFEPIRGDGVYLFDKDKRKILDFSGGIAVNALGYNNSTIEKALIKQLNRGFFAQSNLFYNEEQEILAKKMCKLAGFFKIDDDKKEVVTGRAFFCNSGAEANECAIKMARKRYNTLCDREYNEIICMSNAFHGRTMATISAVGRRKLTLGFEPLLQGFKTANFNDINSIEKMITEHTSAIMLETVQGEGGILQCDIDFLQKIRKICTDNKIVLILDEIQCGNGRTGTYFAYEKYGITPDIVTMAKGIAGGLPMGVCIANEECTKFMTKGSHGGTFGGNALCCCVANAVTDTISDKKFLANVAENGEKLIAMLKSVAVKHKNIIKHVSGVGLMIGIKICDDIDNREFAKILLLNGLSSAPASNNTIRFLPPLIINEEHIREAEKMLLDSIEQVSILEKY